MSARVQRYSPRTVTPHIAHIVAKYGKRGGDGWGWRTGVATKRADTQVCPYDHHRTHTICPNSPHFTQTNVENPKNPQTIGSAGNKSDAIKPSFNCIT